MPTVSHTIDASWTLVQNGPMDGVNVQTIVSSGCRFFVSSTAPADTEEGGPINPGDFRNFDLTASENLYLKTPNEITTEVKITT